MKKIGKIADKPPNRDQPVSYHISDDKMTYDQARGYCFEKNMWLADPTSRDMLDGIENVLEEDKSVSYTVWFEPGWAEPGECWVEEEIGFLPIFAQDPVDCSEKHQAICKMGQIPPAA
jgi:hypothetical protein